MTVSEWSATGAGQQLCVYLEVDPLDRRIRRESWALDEDDLEAIGQRELSAPRRGGPGNTSVNAHEALHHTSLALQRSGQNSASASETECYKLADMLRPG